ncbi:MAG: ribonuclease P protein component [Mycobacteriales bacterium]
MPADHPGAAPPPSRRGRLSRAAEFEAVAQLGRSVGGRYLTVRYRRRERDGAARVGFAVPRKVGGAVDRNAVKRRLRAAVDRNPELLAESTDYVVIARPGLAAAAESQGFDWLCDEVAGLLRQAAPE